MTDKILIYIGRELDYFGIAKFLQDNHDCELYAITELMEKPNRFFEHQKLVKFKKVFPFYDEIKKVNKKPDLKYLQLLEEKYKINFWQIAYTERYFVKYNKYHNFTHDEILSIFETECKFFERILDETKPDYLVMNMTDYQHLRILYEICKAKKIHILISKGSRFGFRWTITDQNKIQKFTEYLEEPTKKNRTITELQNYLKGYDPYKQSQERIGKRIITPRKFLTLKSFLSLVQFFSNSDDRERYLGKGRTRLKVIRKMLPLILKTQYRKYFIKKYLSQKN